MHEHIRDILARISALEDELRDAIAEQQVHFRYRVEGTRIRFEDGIREAHRRLKTGVLPWLRGAKLRNVVTAPIIYGLVVPLALLDLAVSTYQLLCFPLYGVPRVRRGHFVIIDRQHLRYLNVIERLNCVYCGYGNGVLAYAREVAARTEQYWCPIKHARQVLDPHRRYVAFADYGDAEVYRATVERLRAELAAQRAAAPIFPDHETQRRHVSAGLRLSATRRCQLTLPAVPEAAVPASTDNGNGAFRAGAFHLAKQ